MFGRGLHPLDGLQGFLKVFASSFLLVQPFLVAPELTFPQRNKAKQGERESQLTSPARLVLTPEQPCSEARAALF